MSSTNYRSILIFASCVVGTCNIQCRRVFILRVLFLVHCNGKCWYFYFGWGICTSFTCLYTGDCTTSLLSAQRVSPLRFVRINKQNQTRIQDGFHMSTWLVEAKNCAEARLVNEPRAHLSQLQCRKQGQRKHHHPNSPGDHATPNTIPIYS